MQSIIPFFRKKRNIGFLSCAFLFMVVVAILFFVQIRLKTELIDNLVSLPYLDYSTQAANLSQKGVTVFDKEKAYPGYTRLDDFLIDMEGNKVNFSIGNEADFIKNYTYRVYLSSEKTQGIAKINLNASLYWEKDVNYHHDYAINNDTLLFLTKKIYPYNGRMVEFDEIVQLNGSDGKEVYRWSTFEHLDEIKKFHPPSVLDLPNRLDITDESYKGTNAQYDFYHANTINLLPANELDTADKRFQEGNWLISLRNENLIIILDKDTKEIVWSYGPGEILGQHMPVMDYNGHIFIFDNGHELDKSLRGFSRVIELDPVAKKIVWEYLGSPKESFSSIFGGYLQLLPNRNILVTETEKGRVFEVTRDGEIVWEYYNPIFDKGGHRKIISLAVRYSEDDLDKWIT